MTRARHRWMAVCLLYIAVILLASRLPSSSALKATSLFFAKTTTTTPAPEVSSEASDGEAQVELTAEGGEEIRPNITGIPQIDYLVDPNLPRELNGYNLSSYPFYSTVPKPETIPFKCDGLHDGFYASIELKCQVYHHCIYGIRHDFLCANYTAFDQKTFICQFVSEVDCKNSHKFFHRNDALYWENKTTTVPPTTTTTTTTTLAPPRRAGGAGRRRRPYRDEYYDDDYYYPARDDYDYEERGSRRRPRPQRPQARPGGRKRRPYADDYDEEERYERRPQRPRDEEEDYEDRRPYERPRSGARKPDQRRPAEDEEDKRPGYRAERPRRPYRGREDDTEEDEKTKEDRPRGGSLKGRDDMKPRDEMRLMDEVRPRDEIRPRDGIRQRDEIRPRDEIRSRDEIRPRDEVRPRDEIRPRDEVRPRDEIRPRDGMRQRDEIRPRDEVRPRDDSRNRDEIPPRDAKRPRDETKSRDSPKRDETRFQDRYQDRQKDEGRRYREDRPPRNRDDRDQPYLKPERNYDDDRTVEEKRPAPTAPEGQGLVKPTGQHGIFSQPRMPPKIKRPVPATAKDKYGYVPIATTKAPSKTDDDYYDDYEEDDTSRPSSSGKTSTVQRPRKEPVEKEKFKPSRPQFTSPSAAYKSKKRPIDYEDDYYYDRPKSQKYTQKTEKPKQPLEDDDYEYEEERDKNRRPYKKPEPEKEIETRVKDVRSNVKVVKRPFLPSRGGSPYLPRGLQPIAGKNLSAPPNTTPKPLSTTTTTTTTTTEKPTTTPMTEKPTTETQKPEEEYEYYDEDDVEYDAKTNAPSVESTTITTEQVIITQKIEPITTTTQKPETSSYTHEEKAHNVAAQVLRVYNDNYEAIKGKLESTLTPGDYLKPYINTPTVAPYPDSLKPIFRMAEDSKPIVLQPNPDISTPYIATGKPPLKIPENISIKQNLADSIENDYDVTINEAIAPTLPNVHLRNVPNGFSIVPNDRDYTFARFRNNYNAEPHYSASEVTNYQVRKRPQINVSLRTPNSFYIQPNLRVSPGYVDEGRRPPRQLVYRQVQLGNY